MSNALLRSLTWSIAVTLSLVVGISRATANPAGTLFVTDLNGDPYAQSNVGRVLAFDASTGQYLRTVVTGLTVPSAVTIGPGGQLYVTNSGTGQVLSFDPSSTNAAANTGTVFASNIYAPGGLLYDRSDNSMFVSELAATQTGFFGENIYHFNASGGLVTQDGTGGVIGVGSGQSGRAGMAFDSNHNLYVGTFDNNGSILEFSASNHYTTSSTFTQAAYGASQMVFRNGNLLVDAQFVGGVVQYDSTGNPTAYPFIYVGATAFNSGLIGHGSNGLFVSSIGSGTGPGQIGLYNIDTGATLHPGSDVFINSATLAAANGGSGVVGTNSFQPSSSTTYYLPGDFNLDGSRTAADIKLMMQAIANPSGYESANDLSADEFSQLGDLNGDGKFTNADLTAMLGYLRGDPPPVGVPEPSTLLLAALGFGAVVIASRRRS
jgi:hypothetical protein